MSDVTKPVF